MKIQYITNARIPTERAHGLQIFTMCHEFSKTGVELELIVPRRFNKVKEEPSKYYKIKQNFRIKKIFTVDTQPLIMDWMPFLLKAFLSWVQWVSFALTSIFYSKKDSYIYSRDEMTLLFLVFFRKKCVYEVHSLPNSGEFFYKFIFRRCHKIVTITDYMKKTLAKEYGILPEKILCAHDGIDLEIFDVKMKKDEARKRLGLPKDKKIVMYIGALEGWKGHDTLLEASRKLAENTLVCIIGGTKEKVQRLKEEYPEVLFLGFRPFYELPLNQKAADVLIIPNSGKEKISRYYTSPLKLFTYMASKRPIIASDLPSLREVLSEKEAVFFRPDDSEDLVRAIKILLGDDKLQKTLYTNAYKEVKEYTWKRRTENILRFMRDEKYI